MEEVDKPLRAVTARRGLLYFLRSCLNLTQIGHWDLCQISICYEQIGRIAVERCVKREQRKLARYAEP